MQTVSEIPTLVWESATLDACLRYRALPLLSPSADYAAANLYMWDEKYRKQMTFFEGLATVRIRRHDGGYRLHRAFPPISAGSSARWTVPAPASKSC